MNVAMSLANNFFDCEDDFLCKIYLMQTKLFDLIK